MAKDDDNDDMKYKITLITTIIVFLYLITYQGEQDNGDNDIPAAQLYSDKNA